METEQGGYTAFLDIDAYRRPNDSLGHLIYSKQTHTNLYLSAFSHHYLANRLYSPPWHRAKAICDSNSQPQELKFLHQNFQDKRYVNGRFTRHTIHLPQPNHNIRRILLTVFCTTFNHISRVLWRS
jgi:hypothetical protein